MKNRSEGIFIEASGEMMNIDNFISDLKSKAPVAAQIENVLILPSIQAHKNGFQIILSDEYSGEKEITQIGPDIAGLCKLPGRHPKTTTQAKLPVY